MINRGITRKTLLDSLPGLVLVLVGLVAFAVLFSWAMLNMGSDVMALVGKFSFLQKMFEMSMGNRVGGHISIETLFAVCFTHLMGFMMAWTIIISIATRVTVGEIEQGTADLLLSMPVHRSEVYISTSLVLLFVAAAVSIAPWPGIWISSQVFEIDEPVRLARFLGPVVNFFFLNLAVAGLAMLAGCIVGRRSMAISLTSIVVFVSIVLAFIEPFVDPDGDLPYLFHLSLLKYYRPVDVVRLNEWPITHMCLLSAVGIVAWLAGMFVYCRKDIPTA